MQPLIQQDYIQQLSIDCVIFGYRDKQLNVLCSRLNFRGDFWALPSGYIQQEESIDEAARRILEDRTGLQDIYLDQFRVFGDASRNSQDFLNKLLELNTDLFGEVQHRRAELDWFTRRFISIGYYALVDINKVVPRKSALDASLAWYPIKELPALIMDHNEIVQQALKTLRANLDQERLAFTLLPETFTMKEVQELYEAIYDKAFTRTNFQTRMLDLNVLERLEKKFTGAANKAPFLYRFVGPTSAI